MMLTGLFFFSVCFRILIFRNPKEYFQELLFRLLYEAPKPAGLWSRQLKPESCDSMWVIV